MNPLERFGIGIMCLWILFAVHQLVNALMQAHSWKGLSPADWAAWVQAFGSIAAIIGAFKIAQRQHEKERAADRERRQAEKDDDLDAQLRDRALAVRNVVQVASHSLHAALSLLNTLKDQTIPQWESEKHRYQIGQLRVVLDSLITPNTEHLAVLSALEISHVLTQVEADTMNLGGTMAAELLARSETRINEGSEFLDRLIGLKNKLDEMCRARGLPLEISDFQPHN